MVQKIVWSTLILLAGIIVFFQLKDTFGSSRFKGFAPTLVLGNFRSCLALLETKHNHSVIGYKPKTCKDVDSILGVLFSDSKIIYNGTRVIGVQGKDRESGRWYQVDTSDEQVIRVAPYTP